MQNACKAAYPPAVTQALEGINSYRLEEGTRVKYRLGLTSAPRGRDSKDFAPHLGQNASILPCLHLRQISLPYKA